MKIKVLSKKVTITNDKGKENTFYRYFSPVNIEVIENGVSKGIQKKTCEVHFTKDAMKQLSDDKVFAIIDGEISLPYVYEKKVNANGKVDMSSTWMWVRKIETYTPVEFKPRESTCEPVLDDEVETESVEIVG